MMHIPRWRLRDAETPLRFFLAFFLLTLTAGYAIGLVFVDHASTGTARGLAEQFRGSGENAAASELSYEKSTDEMSIFLHNHILSLSLIFFAVGGIFYFSSIATGGLKSFLMIEPFAAVMTTFGGIWLMRYVSAEFSYLVILSGVTMGLCFAAMVILILAELFFKRP